jgi:hypothetical protein
MSAFFVQPAVIDDVVFIMNKQPDDEMPWTPEEKQKQGNTLGRLLWAMNAEALRQRYQLEGTQEMEEYRRACEEYVYIEPNGVPGIQKYKSLRCFLYQCCEGNVPETELFKRVERIGDILDGVFDTPHYKEAYAAAKWDRFREAA